MCVKANLLGVANTGPFANGPSGMGSQIAAAASTLVLLAGLTGCGDAFDNFVYHECRALAGGRWVNSENAWFEVSLPRSRDEGYRIRGNIFGRRLRPASDPYADREDDDSGRRETFGPQPTIGVGHANCQGSALSIFGDDGAFVMHVGRRVGTDTVIQDPGIPYPGESWNAHADITPGYGPTRLYRRILSPGMDPPRPARQDPYGF